MSTEQQRLKSLALPPSGLGPSRHIRASKPCFAAGFGFKEILVEARPGDVMEGAGGAAGPAPEVRHQPPGKTEYI